MCRRIGAIFFAVVLISCTRREPKFIEVLEQRLAHPNLNEFTLQKQFTKDDGILFQLHADDASLFVQRWNAAAGDADRLASQRKLSMESQYRLSKTPYPGLITNVAKCDEPFQPKILTNEDAQIKVWAAELFANERFTFGACTTGQIHFRAVYFLIYCKTQQNFFDLKIFSSPESSTYRAAKLLKEFKCV